MTSTNWRTCLWKRYPNNMTHTVDSRIKQYLYLIGQRW